ncbi:hypothetical protein [Rhodonellum sp.]|uniref:hypothetical protein n=1 Tax=Rhodonellum sp. TaxID=2231180 RepID=UPI00271ED99F|nr:hypothetical protein [Rhodonellum sp.]MDO9551537.1 hypothetical protein [Rhodonellum sp.]
MKSFFLNSVLPELFLNPDLTKEFYLPFNISGILIAVERQMCRPVWITTSLLHLTGKEVFLEKKSMPRVDFLINNQIIPNFTYGDFTKQIDLTKAKGIEVRAEFSEPKDLDHEPHVSIQLEYEPRFLPVFKKNKVVSHVLFYLEAKKEDRKFLFNQQRSMIEEIDKLKTINHQLLSFNKHPVIEVNGYLKIENFNKGLELLFPNLKNHRKSNFLDLWSQTNQTKIAEKLYLVRISQEEELLVFEEMNAQIKKLKLKFHNIHRPNTNNSSILISIENLNQDNDRNKELTKKAFLLQCTQMLSFELEENEANFLRKSSQYIVQHFDLNAMYFLEFNQISTQKTLISFPKTKEEGIAYKTYQSHQTHFLPVTKRNIKHVLSNKVFSEETNLAMVFEESQYLLGVPIYEQDSQIGIMVYPCTSKKIDIDAVYQLYSLTTIFYKIYSYQNRLNGSALAIPFNLVN